MISSFFTTMGCTRLRFGAGGKHLLQFPRKQEVHHRKELSASTALRIIAAAAYAHNETSSSKLRLTQAARLGPEDTILGRWARDKVVRLVCWPQTGRGTS